MQDASQVTANIEEASLWRTSSPFSISFKICLLLLLIYVGTRDFLVFHAISELLSVSVCFSIFLLAWNTRYFVQNNALQVLSVAMFYTGVADLLHTVAYKGMGVFPDYSGNLATQLWIVGRVLQVGGLLSLVPATRRRITPGTALLAFGLLTAALITAVFVGFFPACFVDGEGLTPFKKIMEYLFCAGMLYSAWWLGHERRAFGREVHLYLRASILFSAASELLFTFYVNVYGISNLAGHVFKIVAVYLVYKAIIEIGLIDPFALLFRDLKVRERELVAAREKAEAASAAKGIFLANVSHEVRTPLSGVLGMLKLLGDTPLTPEQKEYVSLAASSGRGLLTVINDILDLSRIEAGRMPFEAEDFNLESFLRDNTAIFARLTAERGLVFESSIDPCLPKVLNGDPARIRQILFNLVGNAVKFTERGSVHVHAECGGEDREGRTALRLRVEDTGPGIPEEQQKRIFEPFVQADDTHARNHGGTGLGLAIVRRLAEAMGGDVTLTSTVGKGSTFVLTIPLSPPTGHRIGTVGKRLETLPEVPPMRILLADDDRVNAMVARKILERKGHTVTLAASGQEVLDLLRVSEVDLVLMDVQMPGMDGIEATRAIRAGKAGRADLPVVALTAHAMEGDREHLLTSGMDDYLTKPLDDGDLNRVLMRFGAASA